MQCKDCKKDFQISDREKKLYSGFNVPEPILCFPCRMIRQLMFRNVDHLYSRKCDLCQKNIISMYPEKSDYTVYCTDCWWGDKWEALDYGQDFDFSRPFFEQFFELTKKVPRIALMNKNTVNAEYNNHISQAKNCYMSSVIYVNAEDIYYCYWLLDNCQDCIDCTMCYKLRKSYYCYRTDDSYGCVYCMQSRNLIDSAFCYDCKGCSNILFCTGLRNQSYCIFNKKVSEEEFKKAYENILYSRSNFEKAVEQFKKIIIDCPRRFAWIEKSENCTGSEIVSSTNCFNSFFILDSQSCNNTCAADTNSEDCLDGYGMISCRNCYECTNALNLNDAKFSKFSWESSNLEYCDFCFSDNDLFGCIGLKHKKFCIFNKQYSEEEYGKLKSQIIEQMKQTGEYGRFFPPEMSPFSYVESPANSYFPITKEEALKIGWRLGEDTTGTFGKETLKPENVSDNINDVTNEICSEILACSKCQRNYKIIPQELKFYQENHLPVPLKCPNCRHLERFEYKNPFSLWHRQCSCDQPGHKHEGQCKVEFETTYSPDRPEKVYCEECYQKEIY